MTPPNEFTEPRATRDDLRERLAAARHDVERAERELRDARRAHGDDSRQAIRARENVERLTAQVDETHQAHVGAVGRFNGLLKDRYADIAIDEFSTIDTQAPLVLLPVRIETRFALGGPDAELWIRIYPDEIHGDGHEPALTDDEVAAGEAYWEQLWDRPGEGAQAWKLLVDKASATRAAWIARSLTPVNVNADHATERPAYPVVPRRTDVWTRAVEARLLPDRWIAIGMRGGAEVNRQAGRAIVEPLALTPDPGAPASEIVDLSGDGLEVDQGMLWTVRFDRAVEVGMGIKMRLTDADMRAGFDELYVIGVKASLDEQSTGSELARLLDAHHYQRGLACLRQGTPTNNTQAAPSGFPPADDDAARSFAIERAAGRSVAGKDGERLSRALGIDPSTLVHVDRADADEQAGARAMCGALWPATWGYFFEELLFEDEKDAEVERFRQFFINEVRPRGALPAFRAGGTPYGVVVTSSLSQWVQRNRQGMMQLTLPLELRRLREFWRRAVANAPRVGRTNDPDKDLLEVLEMDAAARDVRVRSVMGPNASINMAGFLGLNWSAALAEQERLARDLAARFDSPGITSRIFALTYGKSRFSFTAGFVVPKTAAHVEEKLSETEPLAPFNYIKWLREAPSIEDVRDEKLPAGVASPGTLLYILLRHAMLREAARAADTLLVNAGMISIAATREVELVGVEPAAASTVGPNAASPAAVRAGPAVGVAAAPGQLSAAATPWQRYESRIAGVTGEVSVARFVWDEAVRPENSRVREFRNYLRTLEDLPTAELERLLTETLDACSHRLDAWVTAMFTERLDALRARRDVGTAVGGFGWVTDLRPKPAVASVPREMGHLDDLVRRRLELSGASLEEQVSTGGHIHAASMAQAATAAILRNGYLSRRHINGDRYGVDLSSARVRRARWILDAVRNGQSLGAVLGYQFERDLHEGPFAGNLDKYVEPFRAEYPLSAGQLTPIAVGEAVEAITARHVVHGLRLLEDFKAQPQKIRWGQAGLPANGSPDFTAVQHVLSALDDTVDAVADLLLAESVFQLVRGNTAGASASLDSLSRGARPPDPEVIRSPRGGSALIHRVALLLDPAAAQPPAWAGIPASVRSTAEPALDAWLTSLIGDPALVRCAVAWTNVGGVEQPPLEVTLRDLALRALDCLHVIGSDTAAAVPQASEPNSSAQGSELDARIAAFVLARAGAAPHGKVSINYAPTGRATRSFPEIAEVLRAAQAVLSTARTLGPQDLVASSQQDTLDTAVVDTADLAARAAAALAALQVAQTNLGNALAPYAVTPHPVALAQRTALVQALRAAAACGVPRAFVPSPHNEPDAEVLDTRLRDLVLRAVGVHTELTRRMAAATAPGASASQVLDAVFGGSFTTITRFVPPAGVLDQALTAGPAPTPSQVRAWFRGAALVRPPLDRWLAVKQLGVALGMPATATAVTQVPHLPGATWVALPFAPEKRPESGSVGLALLHDQARPVPPPGGTWTGLLLDEWTELIPNQEEGTAVAFHYDDPGAEAPQSVLIAVAPDDRQQWSIEVVRDVLQETLEMARLRAVDRDLLGELEQLLPATFLAANARNDTIATAITGRLARDRAIVAEG